MRIGTKSVIFGAHAFWLHPWFVARAWWKLYGFPWDPRLWVAFFVHDLGYWGKPNMDGEEGEAHPWWGADLMSRLFDWDHGAVFYEGQQYGTGRPHVLGRWGILALYHSRFFAKRNSAQPSRLCAADKLAVALEPWWLYLPRVILSGEIREYMALARDPDAKYGKERRRKRDFATRREWHRRMTDYCRSWAYEHKDGRLDTWTPDAREAQDETGVWK